MKTQLEEYQAQRIEAQAKEISRLNDVVEELQNALLIIEAKANHAAKKAVISNPDFLKPISHLEKTFEIIKPS